MVKYNGLQLQCQYEALFLKLKEDIVMFVGKPIVIQIEGWLMFL